ncbi:MAG TPA: ABC transporter substrate-binding protein [Acidimicrobiales bacterium]|nr:ABC transporter substrate-binding protein [Acidimicrobiales bacterium]
MNRTRTDWNRTRQMKVTGRRRGALASAIPALVMTAAVGAGTLTLPEVAVAAVAPPATKVVPSACRLSALAAARTPVQITMWHTMTQTNNAWLESAVGQFNSSQSKVHVTLVQQPDYKSEFVKYKAGLSSGDLPDLAQFEDTTVQQLVDSRSTVPVQDCIAASHYSLSDYLPRALSFYRYHGVQQSMPWAVSNVIMYYNPVTFQKAGLDPNKPPQTFAQVTADAKKIVASGAAKHGVALPAKPYVFEFLLAKSGGQYVNNGNGRIARASQAGLTSPTALKVWQWWNQTLTSKLGLATGSDPNNIDHLIAIATGNAAMTFEASGIIGPAEAVLASGQYPGVKIRTAPLPALVTGGGVPVGDGSLWISAHSSLAKRAAAWKLIQFLDSPQEQASLATESGYVPVRVSATRSPGLVSKWTNDPNYKVGYTQLTTGRLNNANIGSLIGDYQGVRNAVADGLEQMVIGKLSPKAAASFAQNEANAAIQNYNGRIGTS